jgi:hypothetical protein
MNPLNYPSRCIEISNDQPERRERVSRTLKVLVGISILWF